MNTRTTIVIGGEPDKPVIARLPDKLIGAPGTGFEWEIENQSGRMQEISLVEFTDETGAKNNPLDKNDADRKAQLERNTVIRDRARDRAPTGVYKYEIWLNGSMAVDPELEIKEGG